jgi:hypothetical protein
MDRVRTQRRVANPPLLLVSVLLLLAPQTARTQQLGNTFRVEEQQTAVVRVVPGQFVRARLIDGSPAGGPLVGATPVAFTLGPSVAYSDNESVVKLVSVDSLWVRSYSSRRGAILGGGIGGLLGLGLGVGVDAGSMCPTSTGTRACAQSAVTSAAVGVLIGGVTGSIIGSGVGHWRRLLPQRGWSREPTSAPVARLTVPDDSAAFDKRAMALMRVRPDALVRLTFADRGDLSGYVVRAGARGASIALTTGNAPDEPIAITSLEGIWERGHAGKTGAAIGTLVGSLGGVLVATQSSACNPHENCRMAIIGDGIGGALLGLLAGDRVGRLFPQWHRRF